MQNITYFVVQIEVRPDVLLTERSGRYESTTDNKEMAGEGVGLPLE